MRPGSVIVDWPLTKVDVIETADRVTTHTEPVYENMACSTMPLPISQAVARTSTIALTNVTLPYVDSGDNGFPKAIALDEGLRQVSLLPKAHITSQPVATGLEVTSRNRWIGLISKRQRSDDLGLFFILFFQSDSSLSTNLGWSIAG